MPTAIKKTQLSDCTTIGEDIVALSYCKNEDLWKWVFPNENIRYSVQKKLFSALIKSHVINPSHLSYTLFDDETIIGHAAFSYQSKDKSKEPLIIDNDIKENKENEESKKNIFSILKFMVNEVGFFGIISMFWKMHTFGIIQKDIDKIINYTLPIHWETNQIAIKTNIRNKGYGTVLLSYIHQQITKQNKNNNCNYNVIGMCSTLKAKRFYIKNGRKCLCSVKISDKLSLYWTIWNDDEKLLNYWYNKLKQNGLKDEYVLSRKMIIKSLIPYRLISFGIITYVIYKIVKNKFYQ